jgi:predicted DNA-binding ribbon-helix-helix protein
MASTLVIRNVTVGGRRTSVRLEAAMWDALFEVCRREETTVNALLTWIDRTRSESSLTSALRSHIVAYYRDAALAAERQDLTRQPAPQEAPDPYASRRLVGPRRMVADAGRENAVWRGG